MDVKIIRGLMREFYTERMFAITCIFYSILDHEMWDSYKLSLDVMQHELHSNIYKVVYFCLKIC